MRKIVCAVLVAAVLFLFVGVQKSSAIKIGVTADLHAGENKKREVTKRNVVYPKKAVNEFKKMLSEMEKRGVDICIVLGDNTNKGEKKYAKKLKAVAKKSRIRVLWVRGNHDSTRSMRILNNADYYIADVGDFRFIILDTTGNYGTSIGQITNEQLDWLSRALETEKQVVIAMHHPPIDKKTNQIHETYKEFMRIVLENGRTEKILAGHLHEDREIGIVQVFEPLTLKNGHGYKILTIQ